MPAGLIGSMALLVAMAISAHIKSIVRRIIAGQISLWSRSALSSNAPAMTDFDQDPLLVIKTGDWVKVDADRGIVEVIAKGNS